jgi:hypothetical protein
MKRPPYRLSFKDFDRLQAGDFRGLDGAIAAAEHRQILQASRNARSPLAVEDPHGKPLMAVLWRTPGAAAIQAIERLEGAGVAFDEMGEWAKNGLHRMVWGSGQWHDEGELAARLALWAAKGGNLNALDGSGAHGDTALAIAGITHPPAIPLLLALGANPAQRFGLEGQETLAHRLAKAAAWEGLAVLHAQGQAVWRAAGGAPSPGSPLLAAVLHSAHFRHAYSLTRSAEDMAQGFTWADRLIEEGHDPFAPSLHSPRGPLMDALSFLWKTPEHEAGWNAAFHPHVRRWLDATLRQATVPAMGIWVAHALGDAERVAQWGCRLQPADHLPQAAWPCDVVVRHQGGVRLPPPLHTGVLAAILRECTGWPHPTPQTLNQVVDACPFEPEAALATWRQRYTILTQAPVAPRRSGPSRRS